MKLFIVESPNKCAKLKSYLGSDYKVEASVGHIRSIPAKGINIDIKNEFSPTFEISKGKKDVVKKLKELASKADEIILATDPDREGEAIAWHIYDLLPQKDQEKCKRVTFNEIKKKAVLDALAKPREIDNDLVDAQKARQVLDRLIGYKVSPVLWYTVGSGTSAGRVQSIALKIICERQKEIDAFVPTDFWFIEALFNCEEGSFWSKVVTKEKDNRYLDDKVSADDLEKLKTATYKLAKIEKKTKERQPAPPFDTSSMQQACSSLFGWSATKTMTIAQKLYEQGRVSYIRSDSFNISEESLEEVRELISKSLSKEYLPSKPNKYSKKSSAAAQEAHECIRPTHAEDKGTDIDDSDGKKLYRLIRDRFIACQMTPMVVDSVIYHIDSSTKHKLMAKGQTIKFDGWFKVYNYSKTKEEILPEAKEGENLKLSEIKRTKHTTQPPPRYNDGSLISKMEAEGVGRPSTRAQIIKSIQDKGYVEKVKGNGGKKGGFGSTPLGMKVYEYLNANFTDFFMDIKFTSGLENDLDIIADGKKTFIEVVDPTYKNMMEYIKKAKDNPPPKKEAILTGVKCSVCKEGNIEEKDGKFGKFYGCGNYPDCKTIYIKEEDGTFSIKTKPKIKKVGKKCEKCSEGEVIEKEGKFGTFYACDKYPKCKTIYIKNDDGKFEIKTKKTYKK